MENQVEINVTPKYATDDGSSAIKFAASMEAVSVYPSRVYKGASLNAQGLPSKSSFKVGTVNYSVDPVEMNILPTQNADFQINEISRVLIHDTLRKNGVTGECEIIVTVPCGRYFTDPESLSKNEAYINRKKDNLLNGPISYNDGEEVIRITNVHVLPEGLPALAYCLKELKLKKGMTCLVDIGSTTCDVILFSGTSISSYAMLDSAQGGNGAGCGMFDLLYAFRDAVSLTDASLVNREDKISTEFIKAKETESHPYHSTAMALIGAFEARLKAKIETVIGHELEKFDHVIFSGGGANAINPKNLTLKGHSTAKPQEDNARGCHIIVK